ncbi:hypothetical protein [Marinimicrobium agarilyticum]|uniref:hypothetical protein n=1 Tax=Marinimicrobium agarilyticum TaxID=306546 RepID=UPI000484D3D6|nr:hypothetical protein [Marinimicrobium agarilyticum]
MVIPVGLKDRGVAEMNNEIFKNLERDLPVERRVIASRVAGGPDSALGKDLMNNFWVNNDTDLNEDLGFVFAVKPLELSGSRLKGYYRLYLSSVSSYFAVRAFEYDDL